MRAQPEEITQGSYLGTIPGRLVLKWYAVHVQDQLRALAEERHKPKLAAQRAIVDIQHRAIRELRFWGYEFLMKNSLHCVHRRVGEATERDRTPALRREPVASFTEATPLELRRTRK